eukprot:9283925-Pyramimonas_sp.AAC.2
MLTNEALSPFPFNCDVDIYFTNHNTQGGGKGSAGDVERARRRNSELLKSELQDDGEKDGEAQREPLASLDKSGNSTFFIFNSTLAVGCCRLRFSYSFRVVRVVRSARWRKQLRFDIQLYVAEYVASPSEARKRKVTRRLRKKTDVLLRLCGSSLTPQVQRPTTPEVVAASTEGVEVTRTPDMSKLNHQSKLIIVHCER